MSGPEGADTALAPKRLSITELRQSKHTSLPQRSYSLCLAAGLLAEMRSLAIELMEVDPPRGEDAEQPVDQGPAKHGEGPDPRAGEIRARMQELRVLMDEHTGELILQALPPGEWRRFCDANPIREDNKRDSGVGLGYVNADVLLAQLGDFAHAWNADELQPGDWAFLESKASQGDLNEIARTIVAMHETAVDLPKLRSNLRDSLRIGSD